MSKQIYEEALADVKKLKQIAEDNAKKTLIEAVTPRIRDFIESQLLEYSKESKISDEDEDESEEDLGYPGSVDPEGDLLTDSEHETMLDGTLGLPDEDGKITLDLMDFDSSLGEEEDSLDDESILSDDEDYVLNLEAKNSLSTFSQKNEIKKLFESMRKFETEVMTILNASKFLKESKIYFVHMRKMSDNLQEMYKKLDKLHIDFQTKLKIESRLDTYSNKLEKLQENTTMKRRLFKEEDVTLRLTGLPDDVDFDDVGVDLVLDDEDDNEDSDMDSDEDSDMDSDEDSDMDSDMDSDEGSEDDLELDFGSEEDEEKTKSELRRRGNNVVVEIDEKMLANEIKSMKRLREARLRISESRVRNAKRRALRENLHKEEEMIEVVDEIDELEEEEKEEEMKEFRSRPHGRPSLKERLLNKRSKRVAESTESTKLRKELAESNLFNMKLIYANKVLQNENLSNKQKATIIEKLDEARTAREAKIVFESTVKLMTGQARPIRESVANRAAGSASRATRTSSTTLSENVEANRWAVLAGIR